MRPHHPKVGRQHKDRVQPSALGNGRADENGRCAVADDDVALATESIQGLLDPCSAGEIVALEAGVCGEPIPQGFEVPGELRLHLAVGWSERLREPKEKNHRGNDEGGVKSEQKPQDGRAESRAHPVGKPHHLRRLVDDEKNEEEKNDGAHHKRHVFDCPVHLRWPLLHCLLSAVCRLLIPPPLSLPLSLFIRIPDQPTPAPSSR